ncbi:MAG: oligoendopeptidase F [Treponemataceae bacterium]|nr:MAG: oligoendopeptidase F [Treponemataceae bacterium]
MENRIPERKDVPTSDTWDLSSLYADDAAWEKALESMPVLCGKVSAFKLQLGAAKENLLAALRNFAEFQQLSEACGNYASLLANADAGESRYQEMLTRYIMCATECDAALSFLAPEIQAIADEKINSCLNDSAFSDYKIWLTKLLRMKPYILSEKEERILALQGETGRAAQKAFSVLTNVDLQFGTVTDCDGTEKTLTQSTWSVFMESHDRKIRKDAYTKFYAGFDSVKNTLSGLYEGSVNQDVFTARSRGFSSSRQAALFPDSVPESVYDNLVGTLRDNLAPLHKYYSLRKKILKVDELRHYDVYVPLVQGVQRDIPYDDAVEVLRQALSPLGASYTDILCNGLLQDRWVDRYENKGKRSGAFSSGSYKSVPFILLNYKSNVLRDVFTMAHEGGHSMHSYYCARANPFMQYQYTIFEAEVASTFNEELLFRYLIKHAQSDAEKAYLISTRASDILATLYRQTMFAEFEDKTHKMAESGEPLSPDSIRACYRELLCAYFGQEMHFEALSDLESLRIPHFYNAFYVYKYATGVSASLALANRVLSGGKSELNDYFAFLRSGGSVFPIESLKKAGVDMEKSESIKTAIDYFSSLVDQMERLC